MSFRFVHTADWHIAKPFGAFDDERANRLREARFGAIDEIAKVARATGAGIVLVAGDIFDGPGIADEPLRRVLAKLEVHAPIIWHLLPGNHDAATVGGIWDRIARIGVPANVVVHREAVPIELAPHVVLLPAPLAARHVASDPSAWMDGAATRAGVCRIGLAHGAVQGFGSSGEASMPLAVDRARTAGLSYLALGDWHGAREVAPRTWYSGTPEPDRFLDNDPGFVLAVEIEAADACVVTRHAVAKHAWLKREATAGVGDPLAAIEREVAALGAGADQILLQLVITGRVTLAEDQALRARIKALAPRLLHLDARLDDLIISVAGADAALFGDEALGAVASSLAARIEAAATPAEQDIARHALRRLAELAADAAGGRNAA